MEPDVSRAMLKRVEELEQLSAGIAEHHPYWPALHFNLALLRRLLEKWHDDFTQEEHEELVLLAEKVLDSVKRIRPQQ
ncbi:hypothetical protein Pogu_2242 [Pyrobaculum oguniense TE7]|uniref:Archaeal PaREP1/PaREP8 family n=1 Tax=Pyrobaculum oguniense (strain DSM 13380 / JCM 10595 / TE7) TaxID=698757 RepID=H6QD01_PYROT|nr:hypothetical protein Pogu_2242 [Pyrobaculum oguniense TE7]